MTDQDGALTQERIAEIYGVPPLLMTLAVEARRAEDAGRKARRDWYLDQLVAMTEPDRWGGEVCPFCYGEFWHPGECSEERCGCEWTPEFGPIEV